MSAVVAGSASAEVELHQWLIVHLPSGVHLLLSQPNKIHSLGLILLEDSTSPLGATEMHCRLYKDGTVGPHGLGLTLAITKELLGTNPVFECNIVKFGGCKTGTTATAEAVHLIWHTKFYLVGNEARDKNLGNGNGNPGWSVTCENILGGKTTDTCTAAEPSTGMVNVAAGVEEIFNPALSEAGNCKVGNEAVRNGVGLVTGSVLIENPSATLHLEISFGP
jgi:hypothetical protein